MSINMHYNYKLKHAVTAALSLIAIGFQSSSLALGLSDIDVRSSLGEPLKANINVLGAADLKNPSCLRLGNNSDISHVNFKLGKMTGGSANLLITSNKVINEPILNLSVVAGCDTVITRDYVLLVDPPVSLLRSAASITAVGGVVIVQQLDTAANNSTAKVTLQTPKITVKALKKKRSAKKTVVKSRKKTTQKPATVTQTTNQSAPESIVPATPRLSISSGMPTAYANTIGLRLDKQLKFQHDPNTAIANESIVIDDEVTVMNNRLAHLQAQITKLQKQNANLKTDNKIKSVQLSQASTPGPLSSVLLLLGASLLLLLGGYAGYHWLRRRQVLVQSHNTNAIWVETNQEKNPEALNDIEPEAAVATIKEEDIFAGIDFGVSIDRRSGSASPVSMENAFESTKTKEQPIILEDEEQFSVLDHADVFLSHGRATLAIQLLQNHLLEHPKQSVTIWLFLLDLLAKENLQSLYEEIALDCKLHFNIKITEFAKQKPSANESLEDFPHLTKGLEDVWNTPAAIVYLEDLIYNNRLEPRAGLAKNLIEELVLLRSMAQENNNSAEVIQLDEKKLAIIEQKEALLESKKAEKLKKIEAAERLAQESTSTNVESETEETSFEFTLADRN